MIGFTGTRKGMTDIQKEKIRDYLNRKIEYHMFFAHGDCKGSDEQAHQIALDLGYCVRIYPPSNPIHRAYCKGATKVFPERQYHTRNLAIRAASDVLIATPATEYEIMRSGTWSMIRNMVKEGKDVLIIYPSGREEWR